LAEICTGSRGFQVAGTAALRLSSWFSVRCGRSAASSIARVSGVDDLARTLRAIGESLRHGQPDGALYLFEQWVSRREKSDMAAVAE